MRRFALSLLVVAASLGAGCAGSRSPRINVLGVEQAPQAQRSLLVFVEVVNPTGRDLTLSRLEYRVRAERWFESQGQVRLARQIGAQSSAVVEIAVPVERPASADATIPYTLEGKLFALEDRIERSWNVAVRGALGAASVGDPGRVRVTTAGQ
jgi:hypothetical protein